jgi:hypothetical protein
MENAKRIFEQLGFEENESHGLKGHVRVSIKNNDTGEVSLWEESDNIIPISGYSFALLKMFNLYLDSVHDPGNQMIPLDRDTTLAIPDLNNEDKMHIGIAPEEYTVMEDDNASNHFIQGFMVGNGGSGEDGNTTKNTNYSFTMLRSPIPFQESQGGDLDPSIANKYLGKLRITSSSESSVAGSAYYIKKFEERPKLYHSWYSDGQSWNALNPINANDLGPNAVTPKSNRIESYIQCNLAIDSSDCMAYFNSADNSNTTPRINELGLVAFDTLKGTRSTLEELHTKYVKPLLLLIFKKVNLTEDDDTRAIQYANTILQITGDLGVAQMLNTKMNGFLGVVNTIASSSVGNIDRTTAMTNLGDTEANLGVQAFYNQNEEIQYTIDNYLNILAESEFNTLTVDEAQRIKLFTYYTFASIPLEENTTILFDYRIYAN